MGGGLELALTCDLIVADTTACVGLPEVTIGLIPGGGGSQLLGRRAAWGPAADLLLTGRRVHAAEASRLGILDRIVPVGEARSQALGLAAQIASASLSLTLAKVGAARRMVGTSRRCLVHRGPSVAPGSHVSRSRGGRPRVRRETVAGLAQRASRLTRGDG